MSLPLTTAMQFAMPSPTNYDTSANTNYLGVRTGDKNYADKTQAAMATRDFDFWLANYFPLAQQQAAQVGNEGYLQNEIGMARRNVREQAALAGSERERELGSYGLKPTEQEAATFAKGDKLRAAAADVTAINQTTDRVRDRDFLLMSGARMPKMGG